MKNYGIVVFVLLLFPQRGTVPVSGRVLDHRHKPVSGVQVTYTNVGQYNPADPTAGSNSRMYQAHTDKNGEFVMAGVEHGVYHVEIINRAGERLFTTNVTIAGNADVNGSNVLLVDLPKPSPAGGNSRRGAANDMKADPAKTAEIDRLTAELRGALDVRDWPRAGDLLQQLIALGPNHWEFYQNLVDIQSRQAHYQDAIQTLQKGIASAEKELAETPEASPDFARAKAAWGQMLNSQGNLYAQQSEYAKAIAAFIESARVSPYPALPWFNLCATYYTLNRLQETVSACRQTIAADPAISDAYYIEASALFAQTAEGLGRHTPPAETREVLNRYLQVAPSGQHAQQVREMLDKLDSLEGAGKPVNK